MDAIMREVEALKAERRERHEAKQERKDARRAKKEARRDKKHSRRGESDSGSRGDSPRRRRSRSRSRGRDEPERMRRSHVALADGACAQAVGSAFGLTYASAQAEASARANAAQHRPEYAPRVAPAAEPPRSWTKGSNSVRHAPGKLSEEERAARLAAMAADAAAHEDERWHRLRCEAQRDSADVDVGAAPAHHHAVKPAFLGEQERALFGADSAMNLAERVGALKHYRERGT